MRSFRQMPEQCFHGVVEEINTNGRDHTSRRQTAETAPV